jgi:transcriptional regulator with XRE-family HTH domain
MKFGDIIRELLEEQGISQKQLAAELKLLAPSLGRYIRNEREPDYETLKSIAQYFDVSTDYLLCFNSGKSDTQRENEILRIFRSLSFEQQELYIEQGKAFIRLNKKEKAGAKSS